MKNPTDPITEEVRRRLKRLRKRMSQGAIARLVGVRQQQVSKFLAGQVVFPANLARFAKAVDLKLCLLDPETMEIEREC